MIASSSPKDHYCKQKSAVYLCDQDGWGRPGASLTQVQVSLVEGIFEALQHIHLYPKTHAKSRNGGASAPPQCPEAKVECQAGRSRCMQAMQPTHSSGTACLPTCPIPHALFRHDGPEGAQHAGKGILCGIGLHSRPDHIQRLHTSADDGP